ncbi:uncharacterized protein CG31750 isoform X1 [Drosophila grimshawi]|nr:uncharacterized protein CG31750 isoform X1 [Drosophila grimshawi]
MNSYVRNMENGQHLNRRDQQQIILFYGLYFRIWKLHSRVTKLWLKIAGPLFSSIFSLTLNMSEELFDIIYKQGQPMEKWHSFLTFHIGHCLAPPMRIFLLGFCNNRIEELTILLHRQIMLINLLHGKNQKYSAEEIIFTRLMDCEFNCFVLQQQTRPIRNHIWHVGQTINNEFLLLYLWIGFLNAMSDLQYEFANVHEKVNEVLPFRNKIQ